MMTPDAAENACIIRAVARAQSEGRHRDLLELVHPEVMWHPTTRPGRAVYIGHEGTLQMLDDFKLVLGAFRLVYTEFVELDDGALLARGTLVQLDNDREITTPVECRFTFRDGLIAEMESLALASEQRPVNGP